ncbi:MAG: Nif3-like dinuclear metal center hexameric protein [Lachnospiraceae bacterium]|nr:Nif3-like dinuclear metal center hexameric protein [Lachnospiraceae bacterium]
MILNELIEELEQLSPPSFAEAWDNSGLMCGRRDKEIEQVLLTVDVTDDVVEEAVISGTDVIISHHPLIFPSVSHISSDDITGRKLLKLIGADVACYSMHTNFDVMGMGDEAADRLGLLDREVLCVTYEDSISKEGIGRTGRLPRELSLKDCADLVKEAFLIDSVRIYGDPDRRIRRAAVVPGSGKSMIKDALKAGMQLLITGDIGHHDGLDAVAAGLCVIDAGHYGIEKIFVSYMRDFLKRQLPQLRVTAASQGDPFITL